jgi:hypothetical protein
MNNVLEGEFLETVSRQPPEGWSLGHVIVVLRSEKKLTVEAWRRGAFAVHEVILPINGARLTHVHCGLQIWTFETLDKADECAEALEPLADWDAFKEIMPEGHYLYPKVWEIVQRVDGIPRETEVSIKK